jgi:hypothetical protein
LNTYRTSQVNATVKACTPKNYRTGGSHDQLDGVCVTLRRG